MRERFDQIRTQNWHSTDCSPIFAVILKWSYLTRVERLETCGFVDFFFSSAIDSGNKKFLRLATETLESEMTCLSAEKGSAWKDIAASELTSTVSVKDKDTAVLLFLVRKGNILKQSGTCAKIILLFRCVVLLNSMPQVLKELCRSPTALYYRSSWWWQTHSSNGRFIE